MKSSTNPNAYPKTDPDVTNTNANTFDQTDPDVFPKTKSDKTASNTNAFAQTDPNATKQNAFQKTAPDTTLPDTTTQDTTVPDTLFAPTSVSSNAIHKQTHKQIHEQAHKQTHKQTHKQIHEQTHKQTHKQIHEQAHKQIHEQTPKQIHEQTHKQIHEQSHTSTEQLFSTCKQSHTPTEQSHSTICGMSRSRYVAQAGVIAALYAAATLIVLVLLQGFAWGPVQFRISEAICVVAALTPAAIPGLTAGCVLANLMNIAFSGVGALGLFDVVFGSCATLVGALFCWRMRAHADICVLGFIVANAVIVPLYLPILVQGLGYYTIPFTTISLDGLYGAMYAFGLIATGIGEAIVMYALGEPLLVGLKRAGLAEELSDR